MIGLAMEKWPDDALRRVVDAPIDGWRWGMYLGRDGAACLVTHAIGNTEIPWDIDRHNRLVYRLTGSEEPRIEKRFDALCDRLGLPRAVRACKTRALDILLRRHPLDSKLVVLKAEASNA